MVRIALVFVIIAVGCVAVGWIITKIVASIAKMKDEFKEDGK